MQTNRKLPKRTIGLLSALSFMALAGVAQTTSDSALAAAVSSTLTAESALKSMPIQTAARNGVVTLSGHVTSDAAKVLASSEAGQVAGVRTVLNNLVVDSTPATGPSTPKQSATVSTLNVPTRTVLPVRLDDEVNTQTAKSGDTFHATINSAVYIAGYPLIPAGTPVLGKVDEAKPAGKLLSTALLTIELVALRMPSPTGTPQDVPVTTTQLSTRIQAHGAASTTRLGQQVDLKPQALLRFETTAATPIPVELKEGRPVYRTAATGKAQLPLSSSQPQP